MSRTLLTLLVATALSGCSDEANTPTEPAVQATAQKAAGRGAEESATMKVNNADESRLRLEAANRQYADLQNRAKAFRSQLELSEMQQTNLASRIAEVQQSVRETSEILDVIGQHKTMIERQVQQMPPGERAHYLNSLSLYARGPEKFKANRAVLDVLEQYGTLELMDKWQDFAPEYEVQEKPPTFRSADDVQRAVGLLKAESAVQATLDEENQTLAELNQTAEQARQTVHQLQNRIAGIERELLKAEVKMELLSDSD